MKNAEDRGVFITPTTKVYKGMRRTQPVPRPGTQCLKTKQLTNHRASSGEELVQLQAPVDMSLERALEYIGPDELVEVTPKSIRLRKMAKS